MSHARSMQGQSGRHAKHYTEWDTLVYKVYKLSSTSLTLTLFPFMVQGTQGRCLGGWGLGV